MARDTRMRGFKWFLLNENSAYLGQKVGDIVNALTDLKDNTKGMGTRHLIKSAEGIVHQIRRILHSNWPKDQDKHLKSLQKVGVAIMKAIEEKDDLESIISSGADELQKISGKMGMPINDIGVNPNEEKPQEDNKEQGTAEPQAEDQPTPNQPPEQPEQPKQLPQQPQLQTPAPDPNVTAI